MRFAVVLCALTLPLSAQAEGDVGRGADLVQEGMKLLMQGLMDEIGPALGDLKDQIVDWSLYEAPVILPNGDILIRRKPSPPSEGEIDL
jgi:hypothetical protein